MTTKATKDPRAAKSRTALLDAIDALIETGINPDKISVTDLASRAGVTRPTFYQHFQTITDLVGASALRRLETMFATISSEDELKQNATEEAIRALLSYLCDDATYCITVSNSSAAQHLLNTLVDYIANRLYSISPVGASIKALEGIGTWKYCQFLAAGTIWQVQEWLLTEPSPAAAQETYVKQISTSLLLAGQLKEVENGN